MRGTLEGSAREAGPGPAARRIGTSTAFLALVAAVLSSAAATAAPRQERGGERDALRTGLAWQIALEANGYSPGIIDGVVGPRTRTAIAAVESALGTAVTGAPSATLAETLGVDPDRSIREYRIRREDVALVEERPSSWLEKSRRARLTYASLADLVAERFHTSYACLRKLNPKRSIDILRPGDVLRVPAVSDAEVRPALAISRIEIDLERRLVLLIHEDAAGRPHLHGLLHCSIAADRARAPVGTFLVTTIAENPDYTFDPAAWPEVRGVTAKLRIPPGPRNPVGTCWIGLDRPGIGIHGSPAPQQIGRTGSHGCFRLTNWDVEWLAKQVGRGTPVRIVAETRRSTWPWTP